MEKAITFNAISEHNNFGVTMNYRIAVVSVPDDEVERFKNLHKLTYYACAAAYCNLDLIGKPIKFTNLKFIKNGQYNIPYYTASTWDWA